LKALRLQNEHCGATVPEFHRLPLDPLEAMPDALIHCAENKVDLRKKVLASARDVPALTNVVATAKTLRASSR